MADDYWRQQSAKFIDVANATVVAGGECVDHWSKLKPILEDLTEEVRTRVAAMREADAAQPDTAKKMPAKFYVDTLSAIASVVDKHAKSAQSFLRSSDALERLGIFMQGGRKEAPDAKKLTEKQMAAVVIETCKRIKDERGTCPVCAASTPVVTAEVSA